MTGAVALLLFSAVWLGLTGAVAIVARYLAGGR